MRSIKHRFEEIAEKNPGWSSYQCFSRTVRWQGYNKSIIRRWFKKLVSAEDYDPTLNKDVHFPHFYTLTHEKEARGLPVAGVKMTQDKRTFEKRG